MDELWERAIEAARAGEELDSVCSLTLDGAMKIAQNRMPAPSLLEQFSRLRVLSIANVALTSLSDFPCLPYLEKLNLSDNRLSGGLEHLVKAGLKSLRDLDLSNNKIQGFDDISPLADLSIASLDLYECPVTHLPDYRPKVFEMLKSLKYLDKIDAESNERLESEEEDESRGSEEEDGVEDDEECAVDVEDSEEGDDDEGEEDTGNGDFASTEGEMDPQEEASEEDDGDGVKEDGDEDDEEEDYGTEYLVRPIAQAEDEEDASDFEPGEDEEDDDEIDEEDDQDDDPAPSLKRKRSKDESDDSDNEESSPPKQ